MGDPNGSLGIDTSGLRERLPQKPDTPVKAESVETAQDAVRQLNQQEQSEDKLDKDKKTYGRTPDGTGEYLACSEPGDRACDKSSENIVLEAFVSLLSRISTRCR